MDENPDTIKIKSHKFNFVRVKITQHQQAVEWVKDKQDKTNLFHRSVTARSRNNAMSVRLRRRQGNCERLYGHRVKQLPFCHRGNLYANIMVGFHCFV